MISHIVDLVNLTQVPVAGVIFVSEAVREFDEVGS